MSRVAFSVEEPPHQLTGALEGLAHELGLLQAQMLRMQDVCHGPEMGSALDAAVIRELQGLDLVSQRLGVLSMFVRAVIQTLPYDPAVDLTAALRALPLHDLAERLGARSSGAPEPAFDDADAGDFDLF